MYKFLIGPALMGAGYVAGSVYGADSEQLVHKSREVTYQAVDQAIANIRPSGVTSFAGGTPVPYDIKVDRVADQQLVIKVSFSGREGAQAVLNFVPRNDHDTLVVTRIHSDQSVLRAVLAGTDKARLAYAPDWMLNLAVRPLLQQLASQIDQGGSADLGWGQPDQEAQWEASLSAEQRQQVSEAQQYDATRPAVDPDADAREHMNEGGAGQ
jgi:hypothetical protein